jgi:hypothetical protein
VVREIEGNGLVIVWFPDDPAIGGTVACVDWRFAGIDQVQVHFQVIAVLQLKIEAGAKSPASLS